jgi:hypothetical protein
MSQFRPLDAGFSLLRTRAVFVVDKNVEKMVMSKC